MPLTTPTTPLTFDAAGLKTNPLNAPLRFTPVYHTIVWGGRRMAQWRTDLPTGPIGESWDLADHPRGMSVVADGPLAGATLRQLTAARGRDLIGAGFTGGDFPLLVKLIDAEDRLSVQVHPDDTLAQSLGVGQRGKTECWMLLAPGELFAGTVSGTTRESFAKALADGLVSRVLQRHEVDDGDFVFVSARTVHALGRGCLLYEVQQTCDVTFRVDDWGRMGLDGKPRPLHVAQSLATIDYNAQAAPDRGPHSPHPAGGSVRPLAQCRYFSIEERRVSNRTSGNGNGICTIVTALNGHGTISTAGGSQPLQPATTILIPAAAGPWQVNTTNGEEVRLLVAAPVLS